MKRKILGITLADRKAKTWKKERTGIGAKMCADEDNGKTEET